MLTLARGFFKQAWPERFNIYTSSFNEGIDLILPPAVEGQAIPETEATVWASAGQVLALAFSEGLSTFVAAGERGKTVLIFKESVSKHDYTIVLLGKIPQANRIAIIR